jgi:DNA-binding beta-propeller fold protein YncE
VQASKLSRLLRIGVCCLAVACGGAKPEAVRPLVLFPPPPDTTRLQFLARFNTSRDIEPRPGGPSVFERIVGAAKDDEEDERRIVKPYGVDIYRGRIFICDTGLGVIDVLSLRDSTFEYFRPDGLGQLRSPINCTVDRSDGSLYVTDIERGQVVVYDSTLTYSHAFGTDLDMRPTDVAVEADRVWVTDLTSRKVLAFDKTTLEMVRSFPDSGDERMAQMRSPVSVDVAADRVYVSDQMAFNVKVFSKQGDFRGLVGSLGRSPGNFARNKGLALDRDENLYVVDAAFENVQIFDSEGRLLMALAGGGYLGPGYLWLPAQVTIDYDNLDYFREFVDPRFELIYLVLVTSQYGPDRLSVYGFVRPRAGVEVGQ